MVQQLLIGHDLLIVEASQLHSNIPHSLGLLWTSDQPDAETSAWQNTHKKDMHSSPTRFEPAVPTGKGLQAHALDLAATVIGVLQGPYG